MRLNAKIAPMTPEGVNAESLSTCVSASKPGSSGAQLSSEQAESIDAAVEVQDHVLRPTPSQNQSRILNDAPSSTTPRSEPLIVMLL